MSVLWIVVAGVGAALLIWFTVMTIAVLMAGDRSDDLNARFEDEQSGRP